MPSEIHSESTNLRVSGTENSPGIAPKSHGGSDVPQGQIKHHAGEILHGTVKEILTTGLAKIQLSSGVVTAEVISETLRKGDSVLFFVQETKPKLILKVYSIPTVVLSQKISDTEILRMIGSKNSTLGEAVISAMRSRSENISAETARFLIEKIGNLPMSEKKIFLTDEIVRSAIKMIEIGVPITPEMFHLLAPALSGTINLAKKFDLLRKNAKLLPPDLQNILEKFFTMISAPFSNVQELLERYSLHLNDEKTDSVLDLLREFADIADDMQSSPALRQCKEIAEQILEEMTGAQLNNALSAQANSTMIFFPVIQVREQFIQAQIDIKSSPKEHIVGEKQYSTFRIGTEMSELGEVVASGRLVEKNLAISIHFESEEDAKLVNEHSGELMDSLRKSGFLVQSVRVRAGSVSENSEIKRQQPPMHGLDVVV